MTTIETPLVTRTPWHLWVVGLLSLLWNSGGAYDYLMTVTQNAAYLSQMTAEQNAYFAAMPAWTTAAFAVAVWGAIAGALLLLLRRRWALHAYAVALIAFVANSIYTFGLSEGAAVMGTFGVIFSIVIFVITLFEIWYSRLMTRRGVLR